MDCYLTFLRTIKQKLIITISKFNSKLKNTVANTGIGLGTFFNTQQVKMKERLLYGWTFRRALYAVLGIIIIVQSIVQQQWVGILFGGYFASMGIFAFGCAAGQCMGAGVSTTQAHHEKDQFKEIEFEEVK